MMSKVTSTSRYSGFPKPLQRGGNPSSWCQEKEGKGKDIFRNARTQKIVGTKYGLHSDRKGQESKGDPKMTFVHFL